MNCKQGELAIFVKSTAGHEGKIVRCAEYVGKKALQFPDGKIEEVDCWITEPQLPAWSGQTRNVFTPDDFLRPIRDNDGQDETLTWAGLPTKKGVKA